MVGFIFFRLLSWSVFPFLVDKVPRTKGSGFWIPVIQVVASFILLLSIVVDWKFWISVLEFSLITNFPVLAVKLLLYWYINWLLHRLVSCLTHFFWWSCLWIYWNSKGNIGGNLAMFGQVIPFISIFDDLFILFLHVCILAATKNLIFPFAFSLGWRSTRVWFAAELSHNTGLPIIFYFCQVSKSLWCYQVTTWN